MEDFVFGEVSSRDDDDVDDDCNIVFCSAFLLHEKCIAYVLRR